MSETAVASSPAVKMDPILEPRTFPSPVTLDPNQLALGAEQMRSARAEHEQSFLSGTLKRSVEPTSPISKPRRPNVHREGSSDGRLPGPIGMVVTASSLSPTRESSSPTRFPATSDGRLGETMNLTASASPHATKPTSTTNAASSKRYRSIFELDPIAPPQASSVRRAPPPVVSVRDAPPQHAGSAMSRDFPIGFFNKTRENKLRRNMASVVGRMSSIQNKMTETWESQRVETMRLLGRPLEDVAMELDQAASTLFSTTTRRDPFQQPPPIVPSADAYLMPSSLGGTVTRGLHAALVEHETAATTRRRDEPLPPVILHKRPSSADSSTLRSIVDPPLATRPPPPPPSSTSTTTREVDFSHLDPLRWVKKLLIYTETNPIYLPGSENRGNVTITPDLQFETTVFPSLKPSRRIDAQLLQHWLRDLLSNMSLTMRNKMSPLEAAADDRPDEVTEAALWIYSVAFEELRRQISTQCRENAELLQSLWNHFFTLVELRCAVQYEHEIQEACEQRDEMASRLATAHDALWAKEQSVLDRERETEQEMSMERRVAQAIAVKLTQAREETDRQMEVTRMAEVKMRDEIERRLEAEDSLRMAKRSNDEWRAKMKEANELMGLQNQRIQSLMDELAAERQDHQTTREALEAATRASEAAQASERFMSEGQDRLVADMESAKAAKQEAERLLQEAHVCVDALKIESTLLHEKMAENEKAFEAESSRSRKLADQLGLRSEELNQVNLMFARLRKEYTSVSNELGDIRNTTNTRVADMEREAHESKARMELAVADMARMTEELAQRRRHDIDAKTTLDGMERELQHLRSSIGDVMRVFETIVGQSPALEEVQKLPDREWLTLGPTGKAQRAMAGLEQGLASVLDGTKSVRIENVSLHARVEQLEAERLRLEYKINEGKEAIETAMAESAAATRDRDRARSDRDEERTRAEEQAALLAENVRRVHEMDASLKTRDAETGKLRRRVGELEAFEVDNQSLSFQLDDARRAMRERDAQLSQVETELTSQRKIALEAATARTELEDRLHVATRERAAMVEEVERLRHDMEERMRSMNLAVQHLAKLEQSERLARQRSQRLVRLAVMLREKLGSARMSNDVIKFLMPRFEAVTEAIDAVGATESTSTASSLSSLHLDPTVLAPMREAYMTDLTQQVDRLLDKQQVEDAKVQEETSDLTLLSRQWRQRLELPASTHVDTIQSALRDDVADQLFQEEEAAESRRYFSQVLWLRVQRGLLTKLLQMLRQRLAKETSLRVAAETRAARTEETVLQDSIHMHEAMFRQLEEFRDETDDMARMVRNLSGLTSELRMGVGATRLAIAEASLSAPPGLLEAMAGQKGDALRLGKGVRRSSMAMLLDQVDATSQVDEEEIQLAKWKQDAMGGVGDDANSLRASFLPIDQLLGIIHEVYQIALDRFIKSSNFETSPRESILDHIYAYIAKRGLPAAGTRAPTAFLAGALKQAVKDISNDTNPAVATRLRTFARFAHVMPDDESDFHGMREYSFFLGLLRMVKTLLGLGFKAFERDWLRGSGPLPIGCVNDLLANVYNASAVSGIPAYASRFAPLAYDAQGGPVIDFDLVASALLDELKNRTCPTSIFTAPRKLPVAPPGSSASSASLRPGGSITPGLSIVDLPPPSIAPSPSGMTRAAIAMRNVARLTSLGSGNRSQSAVPPGE